MFTGLIQRLGTMEALRRAGSGMRLALRVARPFADLVAGESVAVDGACLTVVTPAPDRFEADVSPETLKRTVLGNRRPGDPVNLERALRLADRLGGHLVTGHVDCVGRVESIREIGHFVELWFSLPTEHARYILEKGSVAVDGISLTVAECRGARFSAAVIPTTLAETTLQHRRVGDAVNIETDILGKYVEKLLGRNAPAGGGGGLEKLLSESGFLK